MKRLVYLFLVVLAVGCSRLSPEERAAEAALDYYQLLVDGDSTAFAHALARADAMPAEHAQQLAAAHGRYLRDIAAKHGGLKAVSRSANAPRYDSVSIGQGRSQHFVYTFLLLSYGDSTQEEITVPMVFADGKWRIK